MTTIIFQTQATGYPLYKWREAWELKDNWPELVSICWIIYNDDWDLVRKEYHIVRPDGWIIPAEAAAIHGITQEIAEASGKPLREVLVEFGKDLREAKQFISHPMTTFDKNVIETALRRRLGVGGSETRPMDIWPKNELQMFESICDLHRMPWIGTLLKGKPITDKASKIAELFYNVVSGPLQHVPHNLKENSLSQAKSYMKMWGY